MAKKVQIIVQNGEQGLTIGLLMFGRRQEKQDGCPDSVNSKTGTPKTINDPMCQLLETWRTGGNC